MAAPFYALDVSLYTLKGEVIPAKGKGKLTYDPYGGIGSAAITRQTPTLLFDCPPWHNTGRQPFAWSLIPAEGPKGVPTITVVLDRTVRMLFDPQDWSGHLGLQKPQLVVVRVQDGALVPAPGEPVLAHQLVRAAYPWWSAAGVEGSPPVTWWEISRAAFTGRPALDATVTPLANGVRFEPNLSEWRLEIRAPLGPRAAFAYEIYFPSNSIFFLRLVRTSEVTVEGWMTRDFEGGVPQVIVDEAIVRRPERVPRQGASLDPRTYDFRPFTAWDIRLSSQARRVVFILETVVGMIPIVGTLYDVAHLVYAKSTGHSFWGEKVGEDEIAVMGACAILSVAFSAVEIGGSIARLVKSRPRLKAVVDAGVKHAVQEQVDRRVMQAFEQMSTEERKALARTVDAYATGAVEASAVVRAVSDTVSRRVATILEEDAALRRIFSTDLSSFRDAELSEAYVKYSAKKAGGRTLDPVAWAAAQRTGRYRQLLIRELGPDYASVIGKLIDKKVVKQITPDAIRFIQGHANTISHYRDLRRLASGYGDFFQVDHLIERRFWKSPRWNDVVDESDLLSMIVARDPQVARQIPGYSSYEHTVKTTQLRKLIPNGMEDRFTTQQWWDAFVHSFRSVGVDEGVLRGPFKDEFEFLVKHSDMKERVRFRFDQVAEDFTASKKWPGT